MYSDKSEGPASDFHRLRDLRASMPARSSCDASMILATPAYRWASAVSERRAASTVPLASQARLALHASAPAAPPEVEAPANPRIKIRS